MEIQNSQAWTEDGPEVVLEEAQKRVLQRGWTATRPALSVTVRYVLRFRQNDTRSPCYRGWVMRAFLSGNMRRDWTGAEQFYRNAIEVIERGRIIWSDVEKEDRGSIFEISFLFGVKAIHLEAFMQVRSPCPTYHLQ